jgi:hypothetical protein
MQVLSDVLYQLEKKIELLQEEYEAPIEGLDEFCDQVCDFFEASLININQ